MLQGLIWLAQNIALGFYHIAYAVTHPGQWLNWDDPEALIRFIYYGGSVELLFAGLDIVLVLTVLGMIFPGSCGRWCAGWKASPTGSGARWRGSAC